MGFLFAVLIVVLASRREHTLRHMKIFPAIEPNEFQTLCITKPYIEKFRL